MTGILMDPLVRVSADLSGIGEAKCAPGSKPLVEQITHKPFPQLNLGRLVQPDLRDIQDQEGAGNETEDHELGEESWQVPTLQSVVKGLIPGVEPDLTVILLSYETAMIASGNEPAPRTELVANSGIVKRVELVARGGRVKRAELVRPGRQ